MFKLKLPPGLPFPLLRNLRAKYRRAQAQALSRTAKSARAAGVKAVAEETGLKQKDIRKATRISWLKNRIGEIAVEISAIGKALPLTRFGARQTAAGVRFKIGGQSKLRVGAFIVKMPSGHVGVFQRIGEKVKPIRGAFAGRTIRRGPRKGQAILRQPIEEQLGPSIAGAFKDQREAMSKVASARFPIEFRRALENILRRSR